MADARDWLTPFEGSGIAWHESLPSPYTYQEADFNKLVAAVHEYEAKAQLATRPDQPGVRGIPIEEVGRVVEGRIKTAFAPIGNYDDEETARKASWVVNGIEKWGVSDA